MDSAPIRFVQSASLNEAEPRPPREEPPGRPRMEIYQLAELVGFVALVSVVLLALEAAMRRSKSPRRDARRRNQGGQPPS